MSRRTGLPVLMIAIVLFYGACTRENADGPEKQHGGPETPKTGLTDSIKSHKLANFESKTIGNAFDSYSHLTKKEWKTEELGGGYFSVNFIGLFEPRTLDEKARQEGITGRGLEVKFVINPDGSFYLFRISALDLRSDGKVNRTQLPDTAAVLTNIYANEQINL